MPSYADIFIGKQTRSKKEVIAFLDHFLPHREESQDEYIIPAFSDNPRIQFENLDQILDYLENNSKEEQNIYWRNTNSQNPNKHGFVLYTIDNAIIFGISRESDTTEKECLKEIQSYFNSKIGYIGYEGDELPETYKDVVAKSKNVL